jgi:hypothetical protein
MSTDISFNTAHVFAVDYDRKGLLGLWRSYKQI